MADSTTVEVRVKFVRNTPDGELHDCLVFSLADFFNPDGTRKLTNAQVNASIQVKVTAWRNAVAAQRAIITPEPTDDEVFGEFDQNPTFRQRLRNWLQAKGYLS